MLKREIKNIKMKKNKLYLPIIALAFGCTSDRESTPSNSSKDSVIVVSDIPVNQNTTVITATYEGCEMGDYFHLLFKDANGNDLDFGNAKNNLSEIKLYDEETFQANPDYLHKTFELTLDSVLTEYNCCNGTMDLVKNRIPTIIKIKLIQ